ncbi:hypothetical protein EX227_00965 [Providencia rettgeri]|uniref:Uncharacterized protein n=1 Tax=Providencia rettgeri TaxID=587 RepID=A0AAP2JZ63_PRORE|nr:hypothetical protein [Providencia rettgeri]MBX6951409.1 hypothetical protein [Providencia rettgeri]MBX6954198.1 hypothetical protein [Providencia rettgeri]MBX6960776.1 hypothetical protein [Providencia rettgeri]MBX6973240.1 hypothetical protein [Providencia rettgeri]MBX6981374.1 hypothetical protein [Providencia rettgeri]
MIHYIFYYFFVLLGIIAYIEIKKRYTSSYHHSKILILARRLLIISDYIIAAYGIYLASELKEDTLFNWSILVSAVIILLFYLKMIWALESLGRR